MRAGDGIIFNRRIMQTSDLDELKNLVKELRAEHVAQKEKTKSEQWTKYVSLTMVIILTIFPVSFGGTASATNAALASDLLRSQADSGRAFAFMVLGGNVFGLLAPIVTGYIVQITGSFSSAFMLAGGLSLIGAAVSFTMTRHTLGEQTPVAVGAIRATG